MRNILRPLVLASAAATLLPLATACSVPTDLQDSVYLVTTATAAEPHMVLSDHAKAILKRSTTVFDATATIVMPAADETKQLGTVDLTVYRGQDVERNPKKVDPVFGETVATIDGLLEEATSPADDLDLLTGLSAASRGDADTIISMSSGLQTRGLADFAGHGWDTPSEEIISTLEAEGFLPDLTGKSVHFYGLGETSAPQDPLPAPMRDAIEQFWLSLCSTAGAAECSSHAAAISPDSPNPARSKNSAIKTVPVPSYELAPVASSGSTTWSLDSTALFEPNSATMRSGSERVIAKAADLIKRQRITVDITGHTASFGTPAGARELSRQRAQAVADSLTRQGVTKDAIRDVKGVGYDNPIDVAPGEDPHAANRAVTITVVK